MLARNRQAVEPGVGLVFDILVLLEVVGLGHRCIDKNRLCRGNRRAATPEHGNVQRVDARSLKAQLGGDFARRVHLRHSR